MKKAYITLKDDKTYETKEKEYLWVSVDELNDVRKKFIEIGDLYFSKDEIKVVKVIDLTTKEEVVIEGDEENGTN